MAVPTLLGMFFPFFPDPSFDGLVSSSRRWQVEPNQKVGGIDFSGVGVCRVALRTRRVLAEKRLKVILGDVLHPKRLLQLAVPQINKPQQILLSGTGIPRRTFVIGTSFIELLESARESLRHRAGGGLAGLRPVLPVFAVFIAFIRAPGGSFGFEES